MPEVPLEYESDNLIVGAAELTAVRKGQSVCWILPGGEVECNRERALHIALRLDRLIRRNLSKYSRKLFR